MGRGGSRSGGSASSGGSSGRSADATSSAVQAGRSAAGSTAAGTAAGAAAGALAGSGAQAGVVGSAESLMTAAAIMAASAAYLPPALMIAFQFKLSSGKPQNIMKAAYAWDNAADELQKAASELRELVRSIPQQSWSMDDRERYEGHVHEYSLQLDYLHNYCMAVSIILTVLAWALFTYAVFAIGMATYLVALAMTAAATTVTGVGYATCMGLAQTALAITTVATSALAGVGAMAGAVLAAGGSFTAEIQAIHDNQFAKDAFNRALVSGGKTAGVNLLQNAINAGLAYLNRGDGPIDPINRAGGDAIRLHSFPVKEVDLDADRNREGTWTVGAGGKFAIGKIENEIGARAKIQGGDWQGGEVEYKGKAPVKPLNEMNPHNAVWGGKAEWDDRGLTPDNYSGTVGYENSANGSKAGVELGAKDGDFEGKMQAGSSRGAAEVDLSAKKRDGASDEAIPPWDR